MPTRPAVFFDRDGVVNLSPGSGYVLRLEDFHLAPGIIPFLSWCKAQGRCTILVTSQQGVGKGLMSQADLDRIHAALQDQLTPHDAAFDGIFCCTDLEGQGTRRKPSPEMVLEAADLFSLDLRASALIGDHDRDILMARNAGLGFAIRLAGEHPVNEKGDALVLTLSEAQSALETWFSQAQPNQ